MNIQAFLQVLPLAGMGWLGVFVVAAVMIGIVALLGKLHD